VGSQVRIQTFRRPNAERYVQTFDRFVATVTMADGRDVAVEMRAWLAA